jgi:exodeoxyribonuclease VII large subunit
MSNSDTKIWNVTETNNIVREIIEGSLMPFWIQGEVGTLNIHRSGHVYLTLKDKNSQLRSVYFNGANQARQLNLRVGTTIEAFGKLTVYAARGDYQFSIRQLRPVGIGDLQQRFEELKQKLLSEGLLDPQYKKKIPSLPKHIGIVTAPGGAAIRDFLQIIKRRFPNIQIKIYPTPVQGKGAELSIAKGVEFFNRYNQVDVIIVTRGGGSMEDLWAFNEECLAREIAASDIPVISAVGHEIDHTICDMVADLRVPTPSAAAELVIGSQEELKNSLTQIKRRLASQLKLTFESASRRYERLAESYVFKEPERLIKEREQYLDGLNEKMIDTFTLKLERHNATIKQLKGQLEALSPYAVIQRGYAMLTDLETNTPITTTNIPSQTELKAIVADGTLNVIVK